jgi:hypothetical protein
MTVFLPVAAILPVVFFACLDLFTFLADLAFAAWALLRFVSLFSFLLDCTNYCNNRVEIPWSDKSSSLSCSGVGLYTLDSGESNCFLRLVSRRPSEPGDCNRLSSLVSFYYSSDCINHCNNQMKIPVAVFMGSSPMFSLKSGIV